MTEQAVTDENNLWSSLSFRSCPGDNCYQYIIQVTNIVPTISRLLWCVMCSRQTSGHDSHRDSKQRTWITSLTHSGEVRGEGGHI